MASKQALFCMLVVFAVLFSIVSASDVGTTFGDGAISQVLQHVVAKALEEPRMVELLVHTRDSPSLPPLALLDVYQTVDYQNLSVHFHPNTIHLVVDELGLDGKTHVSEIFWPFGVGDKVVNVNLQLPRLEVQLDIDDEKLSLRKCHVLNPSLDTGVEDHWFADKSASVLASLLQPGLEHVICSVLTRYLKDIQHSQIAKLPVHDLIPDKARKFLSAKNATAFYKLRQIRVEEEQFTVLARIEWSQIADSGGEELLTNSSALDIKLHDRNMVTIWLEDAILNSLLAQVDWQFEWMNEQIPVNSEIIPPDSREFLSTLCSDCYFQVNVAARGQPSVTATNNSLVLEKRDRVHLQVVNPNRNQTSVFVSFVLTIVAEVRPSFDDGTLRTLVQLIDTDITMESGAFPKNWGLFMQDLMRGMIMDMLWPEIKSAIEELTYSKGLSFTPACGIDPAQMELEIYEGAVALSSRMHLSELDPEECLKELKRSLPNTSKLFGQHRR